MSDKDNVTPNKEEGGGPVAPAPSSGAPPQPPTDDGEGGAPTGSAAPPGAVDPPPSPKDPPPRKLNPQNRFQSGASAKVAKSDQDLIKPYVSPPVVHPIDPDVVKRLASDLAKEHLLFLSSADPTALESAAHLIARHGEHEARHKCHVFLYKQPDIDPLTLADCPLAWDDQTVMIVSAAHADARAPLNRMMRDLERAYLRSFQEKLKKRRWILVLTSVDVLGEPNYFFKYDRDYIPHADVDWLRPRLSMIAPTAADGLCSAIERQYKEGRWGRSDRDRYDQLRALNDEEQLKRAVEERDAPPAPRGSAATLVSDASPLERAVLYTASMLPNLALDDFEAVLDVVLGEKREELSSKKGDARKPPLLKEVWRKRRPEVLARCKLRTNDAGTMLTFDPVALSDQAREALVRHDPWIHLDHGRSLRESGIIYTANQELSKSLLQFFYDLATASPERQGAELLPAMLSHVDPERRARDLDRLGQLYTKMASYDKLAEAGPRFLNDLVSKGRYEDLLDMVRRLRNNPGFDEIRWLRQVIERGSEEARSDVKNEMVSAVRAGGPRARSALGAALEWMSSKQQGALSETAGAIIAEVYDLFFFELLPKAIGSWRDTRALTVFAEEGGGDLWQSLHEGFAAPVMLAKLKEHWDDYADPFIQYWPTFGALQRQIGDQHANDYATKLAAHWLVVSLERLNDSDGAVAVDEEPLVLSMYLANVALSLGGEQDAANKEGWSLVERAAQALLTKLTAGERHKLTGYLATLDEALLLGAAALRDHATLRSPKDQEERKKIRERLNGARRRVRELRSFTFQQTRKRAEVTT